MINIVTAFPGEARPLIAHLGVSDRYEEGPYTLYRNENRRLLITGGGKAQATAATGWLRDTDPASANAAWLNIGIAGHACRSIGEGVLAHHITDRGTGQNWYPPQVHGLTEPSDRLITVDQPETAYPEVALYDMEAAAFYPVACRTSTAELVQCYKVVSDNRDTPIAAITPKLGEALITDRLADITRVVTTLEALSEALNARTIADERLGVFMDRWHFTVSQGHQLEKLLRRWDALLPDQPVWCKELRTRQEASKVLHWLEQRINAVPVRLD